MLKVLKINLAFLVFLLSIKQLLGQTLLKPYDNFSPQRLFIERYDSCLSLKYMNNYIKFKKRNSTDTNFTNQIIYFKNKIVILSSEENSKIEISRIYNTDTLIIKSLINGSDKKNKIIRVMKMDKNDSFNYNEFTFVFMHLGDWLTVSSNTLTINLFYKSHLKNSTCDENVITFHDYDIYKSKCYEECYAYIPIDFYFFVLDFKNKRKKCKIKVQYTFKHNYFKHLESKFKHVIH